MTTPYVIDACDFSDPVPVDPRGLSDADCCDSEDSTRGLLCSRSASHPGPHLAFALYPSGYVRIQEVWQ